MQLAAEEVHAAHRVREVVKLGFGVLALHELTRLDDAPDGPHRMRRGAPGADMAVELLRVRLEGAFGKLLGNLRLRVVDVALGVREVRTIEVSALLRSGIEVGIEYAGCGPVVVHRPLVEVVRDVEGGRVRGSVLEVNDYDLWSANLQDLAVSVRVGDAQTGHDGNRRRGKNSPSAIGL